MIKKFQALYYENLSVILLINQAGLPQTIPYPALNVKSAKSDEVCEEYFDLFVWLHPISVSSPFHFL